MSCEGKELHRLNQHDLKKALTFHQNRIGQSPISRGVPKINHGERVVDLKAVAAARKASAYMIK